MKSTVDEFWRMIWEHRVSAIMMLCQVEERGKVGREGRRGEERGKKRGREGRKGGRKGERELGEKGGRESSCVSGGFKL